MDGLRFRVAGDGIAGHYAAWLLADLGGEVEVLTESDVTERRALHAWLTEGTKVRRWGAGEPVEAAADGVDGLIIDVGEQVGPGFVAEVDAMAARHPRLVTATISPFGLTGSLAHRRATSYEVQAYSGIPHYIGPPDGPPTPMGAHVMEMATGANAALAVLLGIRRLRRCGRGGVSDVSVLETAAGLQASRLYTYAYTGLVLKRTDTVNIGIAGFLPCKDGFISLIPHYTPWEYFTGLLELSDDDFGPEIMALPDPLRYLNPRTAEIATRALREKTRWEWVREAQTWRIPCVPIQDPGDMLTDEQFAFQEYFRPFAFGGRVVKAPRRTMLGEICTRSASPIPLPAAPSPAVDDCLALDDVKVVEFGIGWSAPMSSVIFAQHGATAVRVESPMRMDTSRNLPLLDLKVRRPWYLYSYNSHPVNSGKLHLGCDLNGTFGPEIRERLLRWADVLLTNYSPRALINLGLDGPAVATVNPNCVTVNSTSFGFDGPYRDYVAYGTGMEGMTGVTVSTGGSATPYRSTILHPDIFSALHNCIGAVAGLLNRERTGRGTWVDLRQYECGVVAIADDLLDQQLPEEVRTPHPEIRSVLPALGDDQWVALTVGSEDEWRAAFAGLSAADEMLAWDEAQADLEAARAALGAVTARFDRETAVELLAGAGLPAAPLLASDEVLLLPHLKERGYWTPATSEAFGTRLGIGYWSHLRDRKLAPVSPVRPFGADNRTVLVDFLRYTPEEADAIEADGTVSAVVKNYVEPGVASQPIEAMLEQGLIVRRDADHVARLGLWSPED